MSTARDTPRTVQRRQSAPPLAQRLYVPLMLAPVVLVLGVLFVGSLAVALLQSFGYAPLYGINEFPTLRHYRTLFSLPGFWASVGLTFYYAVVPTLLGTALSVYLALKLRERFFGRRIFQYI